MMKFTRLTPAECQSTSKRLQVDPLILLKGKETETIDDEERYVYADHVGITTVTGDDLFQFKGLSPNIMVRSVRIPHQTMHTVRKRLRRLQHFFSRRHRSADIQQNLGEYFFECSFVQETTSTSTLMTTTSKSKLKSTTVHLVLNYISNKKERKTVMSADAHDNILEALAYDFVNPFQENFDLDLLRQATQEEKEKEEEEEQEQEEEEEEEEFDEDEYDKKLGELFGSAINTDFTGRVTSEMQDENQENQSPSTPTCSRKKKNLKKKVPSSPTKREPMTWHLDEDTHLGRGAFGDVVAGWLILPSEERGSSSSSSNQRGDNIKERVAIKILKTGCGGDLRDRDAILLNKEIRTMEKLQHDHIVKYYGSELKGTSLYIFCEFMPGGSLDKLIKTAHKGSMEEGVGLSMDTVKCYGYQILDGLAYLHEKNIAHLDLKPANVLVGKDRQIKIADFDKCKQFDQDGATWKCAQMTDSCIGTALFSAPEIVSFKGQQVSKKSDLWSFGCTLVNMMTGVLPWHEHQFQSPYRVLGFMQTNESIGGPVQSNEMKRIFQKFNHVRDLLDKCFRHDHTKRPSSDQLFKTHRFFDDQRWRTDSRIQRRRSSDAMVENHHGGTGKRSGSSSNDDGMTNMVVATSVMYQKMNHRTCM